MGESDSERFRAFWADEVADRVEARGGEEPIVVKGGISPSGVPHLGNMNEVMRGYYVAEALRERGYEVRQLFTTDDRDPLRSVPRTLADLDGNIVSLGEVNASALGRNLGLPYTDIPDPFGCCDSYGDHFSNLIEDSISSLGVDDFQVVSNTELYESGQMEAPTRRVLEQVDEARNLMTEHQDSVDDSYIPFNPICDNCGMVVYNVKGFCLEENSVEYHCSDVETNDHTIEGCGHRGETNLRSGKLPWRFEWPAQWQVLDVDFEPFGKDHAEGSWPSGVDISESIFNSEPPEPMVYEWFTVDGEPLSSSSGNVTTTQDILNLVEPEVLRYFFAKDPSRARDFSIEDIDQLVNEFDQFEESYFGTGDDGEGYAERVYPLVVQDAEDESPRIPYTEAAVLGMFDDADEQVEMARNRGYISDSDNGCQVQAALSRIDRAQTWSREVDNEYNYNLRRDSIPEVEFGSDIEEALDDLARAVEESGDGESIQESVYRVAEDNDIETRELFEAGYQLFLDRLNGPRLGPFLARLDSDFCSSRLRRQE